MHGCKERGAGGPLDHTTGVGRVDEHVGYYADARAKGHTVVLLITEALGGMHDGAIRLLNQLEKAAKKKGGRDGTVYGRSRMAAHTHDLHVHRQVIVTKGFEDWLAC